MGGSDFDWPDGASTASPKEWIVNRPTLPAFASALGKGLISLLVVSAFFLVLRRFAGGIGAPPFREVVSFFGGGLLLMMGIFGLNEPMLILKRDGVVVVRWRTKMFHIGKARTYPPQPLNPVEVITKGRGGRGSYVRLPLWDTEGHVHSIRFRYISLEDLQGALAQR
jgi:hypothetical protein